jgi:UDP-sugar diphosphatase
MDTKIENFRLEKLENGKFVQPKLVTYIQDGVKKNWEIVEVNDSVAILIFDCSLEKFILVRQFRPALFVKDKKGITLELCAGIVDKDLTLEEIAAEEIFEECGYRVDPKSLIKINSFYTSVGFAASKQTLFFVEVDLSMKVNSGGGIEAEKIEVVEVSKEEAKKIIFDDEVAKTPGLCFAFSWYFLNKDA